MIMRIAKATARGFRRVFRREDGTASIEFVVFVPIVLSIFMASVEAGFYMIRTVMLERGLDLVMRDFRLGRLDTADHNRIRDLVCDATPVLPNCEAELKVWIAPMDQTAWVMPDIPAYCGDGNGSLTQMNSGSIVRGGENQIMVVRVCTLADPIFPSTGVGLQLRAHSVTGDYQIAAATVVLTEPR